MQKLAFSVIDLIQHANNNFSIEKKEKTLDNNLSECYPMQIVNRLREKWITDSN